MEIQEILNLSYISQDGKIDHKLLRLQSDISKILLANHAKVTALELEKRGDDRVLYFETSGHNNFDIKKKFDAQLKSIVI